LIASYFIFANLPQHFGAGQGNTPLFSRACGLKYRIKNYFCFFLRPARFLAGFCFFIITDGNNLSNP